MFACQLCVNSVQSDSENIFARKDCVTRA